MTWWLGWCVGRPNAFKLTLWVVPLDHEHKQSLQSPQCQLYLHFPGVIMVIQLQTHPSALQCTNHTTAVGGSVPSNSARITKRSICGCSCCVVGVRCVKCTAGEVWDVIMILRTFLCCHKLRETVLGSGPLTTDYWLLTTYLKLTSSTQKSIKKTGWGLVIGNQLHYFEHAEIFTYSSALVPPLKTLS